MTDFLKLLLVSALHAPIASMAGAEQMLSANPQPIAIPFDEDASHATFQLSPEWNTGTYEWKTRESEALKVRGTAFIFYFPFSISCADIDSTALEVGIEGGASFRVYPPFEVGDEKKKRLTVPWTAVPGGGPNPRRRFEVFYNFPQVPAAGSKRDCGGMRLDILINEPAPQSGIPLEDSIIGDPRWLVSHFLRIIRHKTRQWWILRDDGPRRGPLFGSFPIAATGLIHGLPTNYLEIPRSFEIARALNTDLWLSILQDLQNGFIAPQYDSALLDSYYFCAAKDAEASVMALAQAVENARTVHIERAVAKKEGVEVWSLREFLSDRTDLGRNRWALPRHFTDIADLLLARDLSQSDPEAAAILPLLWECRGNVAHGHPATIIEHGKTVRVGPDKVSSWFSAARRAIAWLESL